MYLFEQYKKKTALNRKDEDNFNTDLNLLQVSVAKKLMYTTGELKTDDGSTVRKKKTTSS